MSVATFGVYPERRPEARSRQPVRLANRPATGALDERAARRHAQAFICAVHLHRDAIALLSEPELERAARQVAADLRRDAASLDATARCFAMTVEAVRSVLGFMPHDEQLMGAWYMTNGTLVEMETGEGKTVTAIFSAVAQALAGRAVHIVTTNDYLAGRDAREVAPVYERMGLAVGCVTEGMSIADRVAAYGRPVVYVTPKQVMFDYLRDRIRIGNKAGSGLRTELMVAMSRRAPDGDGGFFLRGLQSAIVDEADSVLIDEAVVPLIISKQDTAPEQAEIAEVSIRLAGQLQRGRDFLASPDERDISLTEAGKALLEKISVPIGGVFASRMWREQYLLQALAALHLFRRDREYIIRGDAIEIVDLNTGRTMPDRSWERGLHQMIQAKEGIAVTAPNEVMARISHQHYFTRYHHLSGMSGTVLEVADEIRRSYGVSTVRIPTHRALLRRNLGTRIHPTAVDKYRAIAIRARDLLAQSRPVLIGTRTVAESERVADELREHGIPHTLLNARHDADEAAIIAAAGRLGAVTVATNMAGRGTDIKVEPAALARGGLHVIASGRHESRRIDRQLFGRTARQGDPGSYEEILSLDDQILMTTMPHWLIELVRHRRVSVLRSWLMATAQVRASQSGVRLRRNLCRYEHQMQRALSFAGS